MVPNRELVEEPAIGAARIIDLREQEVSVLPAGLISSEEALAIAGNRTARVAVEWPNTRNGQQWRLRPTGWIGSIPITRDLTVRISSKIPPLRLFELLDHVNGAGVFRLFPGLVETADIEGLRGVVARMLVRRIAERIGVGLQRGYREERYVGQNPRGRILTAATLRRFVSGQPRFECSVAPITADIEDNQILAWTLHKLAASPLADVAVQSTAISLSRRLAANMVLRPFSARECRDRIYSRSSEDYRELHALCAMILEATGPDHGSGEAEFVPFGVWVPGLFERAMVSAMVSELEPEYQIRPKVHVPLGGGLRFEIDAVVCSPTGKALAVVDAKYRAGAYPEDSEIHQVVAYATAMGACNAVLVYASKPTLHTPLKVGAVDVSLLCLDASQPFTAARDALGRDLRSLLRRLDGPADLH